MCYPKDSPCVILALGEPQIFILHLPPVGLVSVLKSLRRLPQAIYLLCTACLQVGRSSGLGEGICPDAPPTSHHYLIREKPFLISSSCISLARMGHVIFHVKYQQVQTAELDGHLSAWATQIAMKTWDWAGRASWRFVGN